ncbi:hypothetical protein KW783_02045, partial [Candidatus Parcubacteria bacterium]|nr:hypothetical protein [Candidatus Parcubacteria bacterium]
MIDRQFSDLPDEFRKEIQIPKSLFGIAPSAECPNGVRGRMAVFECLEMDKNLESVILKNPTEPEITKVARAKGMLSMKEDALLKAFNGIFPIEEVNTL